MNGCESIVKCLIGEVDLNGSNDPCHREIREHGRSRVAVGSPLETVWVHEIQGFTCPIRTDEIM